MSTLQTAPSPPRQGRPLRPVPIMISLMLALIPLQLDALVAATALPSIAGDFGEFGKLAWITTSYLLTMAIGTIASGRLGDMFGRRRMMLAALGLFLVGSLGSGLAAGMTSLVAARAVQGLGAGMMFTTLIAIIAEIAAPEKRARYQGLVAAVAPLSMIVGPWVGGIITDHLGWRWIFLLNVPLIGLALIGAIVFIHLPKRPVTGRIDVAGLVAVTVASTGLVLTGTWAGSEYAWASPQVIAALAVGVAGVAALIVVERRAAHPVLPLHLFRDRSVVSSFIVLALAMGAVMMAAINFLPVFMEIVQHRSASDSGLLLLPMLLPAIAVSLLIGGWTTRGRRFRTAMIVGTAVLTIGVAGIAALDAGSSALVTAVLMVMAGAGIGMLFQTPMVLVQNSVKMAEVGAATGTATFLRTVGGALGVGTLGSAFTARLHHELAGSTVSVDAGAVDPHQLAAMSASARAAVEHAVVSANGLLFTVAAILAGLAVLAALMVRRDHSA